MIRKATYLIFAQAAMVAILWPYVCSLTGNGFLEMLRAINQLAISGIAIAVIAIGILSSCVITIVINTRTDLEFVEALLFGIMSGLFIGTTVGVCTRLLTYSKMHSFLALIPLLFVILFMIMLPGWYPRLIIFVRQVCSAAISTFRLLYRPTQLSTYSFKTFARAIAFFPLAYIGITVFFSLWFHSCYLETADFFHTGEISSPNLWHFVYFSFVTITTLGYGDIFPTRFFPQLLVMLEVIFGMGLIVVYLNALLQVLGNTRNNGA